MLSSIAFASREREQSILDHMPQVKMLAARLHRRCPASVLFEDLVSAGISGLIEATDRYDWRRNVKLKTLAEHRIRGAMLDYLRHLDPLPRAVRNFIRKRDSATTYLEHQFHEVPSDDEVADFMRIPIEQYRRLSHIARAHLTVSLDSSRDTDHNPGEIAASDDRTPDTIALNLAIESLPPRERTVISMLQAGYRCNEIARRLGITPGRVFQVKYRAVVLLRIALGVVPATGPRRGTRKTQLSERAL